MKATKKEIQMSRMIEYFIEATTKIIKEEGVAGVTAHKVGDLAGYASSTIYNYFDELSHLTFFASLRFLQDYLKELTLYIENAKSPIEKYLSSWECFCKHSFRKPEIFNIIFISDLGEEPNELLKKYYNVYKNDLLQLPEEIKMLVLENDLSKRSKTMIREAIDKEILSDKSVDTINDITILLWKGMLTSILNNRVNYSPEEATEITMNYIREIVSNYVDE